MNRIIVTGLDFSEFAVTAAMVEQRHQTSTLLALQRFDFASDIFADHGGPHHQEIVNKLIKVKNSQPLFKHKVALAIPDSVVVSKAILTDKRLPFEQQRLSALHQFAKDAPFPLPQLSLDYRACEQGVMVYAAKKAAIDLRCNWVSRAGMKTVLVDTEKQAFLRLLTKAREVSHEEHRLLIEISRYSITFGFITAKEQFYRHLDFHQQEGLDSNNMVKNRQRLTQELERIKALHFFSGCSGVWLINHLDHHDLFTYIADITGLVIDPFPFEQLFTVKRSWQPKSLFQSTKACAIALRGVDAIRGNYAA